jgi:hypothetical protein
VFQKYLRLSADVMQALGLTCIRAPGEGEALCAQLCAVGAATAVWTTDGDALLYGAPRVYRSLKLSRQNMRTSEAEHIDIRVVRSLFGLSSQCDCHETLVAFAHPSGDWRALWHGTPTGFFGGTGLHFVAASGRHLLFLCLMRGALPLPAQK